ncbi:MAG: hypothetical protein JW893_04995 [Candidatus Omnitrophica bacterium]|nr:hypothetical protein [Candidatus Omnitrophota bacterium]
MRKTSCVLKGLFSFLGTALILMWLGHSAEATQGGIREMGDIDLVGIDGATTFQNDVPGSPHDDSFAKVPEGDGPSSNEKGEGTEGAEKGGDTGKSTSGSSGGSAGIEGPVGFDTTVMDFVDPDKIDPRKNPDFDKTLKAVDEIFDPTRTVDGRYTGPPTYDTGGMGGDLDTGDDSESNTDSVVDELQPIVVPA